MVYIKCKRGIKIFRYSLSYFVTVFVSLFFNNYHIFVPSSTASTTSSGTDNNSNSHDNNNNNSSSTPLSNLGSTHNSYLTYISPTLGMKIEYPSSWQKVEGNVGVMFLSPQENDSDEIRGGLGILVFRRSNNMSIYI